MHIIEQPPLLLKRCNCTTTGLGYLEVGWVAQAKNFPWGSEPVITLS
jgi:hypothetical protein